MSVGLADRVCMYYREVGSHFWIGRKRVHSFVVYLKHEVGRPLPYGLVHVFAGIFRTDL